MEQSEYLLSMRNITRFCGPVKALDGGAATAAVNAVSVKNKNQRQSISMRPAADFIFRYAGFVRCK